MRPDHESGNAQGMSMPPSSFLEYPLEPDDGRAAYDAAPTPFRERGHWQRAEVDKVDWSESQNLALERNPFSIPNISPGSS
jgi:hypothetical protein